MSRAQSGKYQAKRGSIFLKNCITFIIDAVFGNWILRHVPITFWPQNSRNKLPWHVLVTVQPKFLSRKIDQSSGSSGKSKNFLTDLASLF